MNKTLARLISMAIICTEVPSTLACGMPPAPNDSFFSIIDPVDALFLILATLTISIAIWPSLQKLRGKSTPSNPSPE